MSKAIPPQTSSTTGQPEAVRLAGLASKVSPLAPPQSASEIFTLLTRYCFSRWCNADILLSSSLRSDLLSGRTVPSGAVIAAARQSAHLCAQPKSSNAAPCGSRQDESDTIYNLSAIAGGSRFGQITAISETDPAILACGRLAEVPVIVTWPPITRDKPPSVWEHLAARWPKKRPARRSGVLPVSVGGRIFPPMVETPPGVIGNSSYPPISTVSYSSPR